MSEAFLKGLGLEWVEVIIEDHLHIIMNEAMLKDKGWIGLRLFLEIAIT